VLGNDGHMCILSRLRYALNLKSGEPPDELIRQMFSLGLPYISLQEMLYYATDNPYDTTSTQTAADSSGRAV
jgi:hypothetical protein